MKFWPKTAVVGLAAVALVIAGGIGTFRATTPEQKFERLSDKLLCQCNCGQHLNGCNMHPCGSAYPMRDEIRASLAAGKDEDEIVKGFVEKKGPTILAAPPAEGVALMAWVMPVVALLFGLYVIYRIVGRVRTRPLAALAGAASIAGKPDHPDRGREALLDRYAAEIDKDLERDA